MKIPPTPAATITQIRIIAMTVPITPLSNNFKMIRNATSTMARKPASGAITFPHISFFFVSSTQIPPLSYGNV